MECLGLVLAHVVVILAAILALALMITDPECRRLPSLIWRSLCIGAKLTVGWDLRSREKSYFGSQFGGQSVVGLFTVLSVAFGGLITYQRDRVPELGVVLSYVAICTATGVAAFIILKSRNSKERAYDVGTLMLARWAVFSAVVSVLGITTAYNLRTFPFRGVRNVRLQASDPEVRKWAPEQDYGIKKDDAKVVVPFRINARELRATFGGSQDVDIKLADGIAWCWQIGPGPGLYRVGKGGEEEKLPQPGMTSHDRGGASLVLHDLDDSSIFILKIALHRYGPKIAADELVDMIKHARGNLVSATLIVGKK